MEPIHQFSSKGHIVFHIIRFKIRKFKERIMKPVVFDEYIWMFRGKTAVITFCFTNFLQDWPWYSSWIYLLLVILFIVSAKDTWRRLLWLSLCCGH